MPVLLVVLASLTPLGGPLGAQAPAPGPTVAEVAFVQGMIAHHAQAVVMTALVPTRTTTREVRLLAERIDVSQQDEIAQMRRWLTARGVAEGDDTQAHHHGGPMPGMLTPEQVSALGATSGAAFDRLFLEGMIRHHEGALVMVANLFATGGTQDPELFQFASDVDTDQRMEIRRMAALFTRLFPG